MHVIYEKDGFQFFHSKDGLVYKRFFDRKNLLYGEWINVTLDFYFKNRKYRII